MDREAAKKRRQEWRGRKSKRDKKAVFIEVDGHKYRIDQVTPAHGQQMTEYAQRLMVEDKLKLDGRDIEEVVEEWCKTFDGTCVAIWLIIKEDYQKRTGRELTLNETRLIIKDIQTENRKGARAKASVKKPIRTRDVMGQRFA